jgi:hypothetical protein
MALTPKQKRFVAEYQKDQNATQAAIRAGYSKNTARVTGPENLSKPDIAAAINGKAEKHLEKVDVSAERILEELATIAFSNIRDYVEFDDDGRARVTWDRMPPGSDHAIQSIGGRNGISLHSKLDAIKTLIAYAESIERRKAEMGEGEMDGVTDYDQLDWVERARIVGQVLARGRQQLLEGGGTKH